MEQKFFEFVAEVLDRDVSELSMESSYKNGDWSSLMHLRLMVELCDEFATLARPYQNLSGVVVARMGKFWRWGNVSRAGRPMIATGHFSSKWNICSVFCLKGWGLCTPIGPKKANGYSGTRHTTGYPRGLCGLLCDFGNAARCRAFAVVGSTGRNSHIDGDAPDGECTGCVFKVLSSLALCLALCLAFLALVTG